MGGRELCWRFDELTETVLLVDMYQEVDLNLRWPGPRLNELEPRRTISTGSAWSKGEQRQSEKKGPLQNRV